MVKDYIDIKLCSNNHLSLNNLKIKLKDKCNKLVYESLTNNLGKARIPICNNEVYKLVIYSNFNIVVVPIIAIKDQIYCINISPCCNKKHLITILLMDNNYPNLKINGGNLILWQDTQFQ